MSQRVLSDVTGVLKGLQKVASQGIRLQENYVNRIWANSSFKAAASDVKSVLLDRQTPSKNIQQLAVEALERSAMVYEGVKAFTNYSQGSANAEVHDSKLKTKYGEKSDQYTIELTPQQIENVSKPTDVINRQTAPNRQLTQTLSIQARQRKVPSTRLARMVSFGSLAAGLGIGTMAEMTRRTLGWNDLQSENPFLTHANAERIVNTLCKVRGAALKIGQLLSIQDSNVINPTLQAVFERVRQSADFMPYYQVEKVMKSELGPNWRDKFAEFSLKPFAAASIGQVHWGKLHDGIEIAVKIQYPGVADGINSDIENLVSVLNLWNVFPDGMFIDKLVEVAKKELAWEVDYLREAECTKRFKDLLSNDNSYFVPRVVDDLSTKKVFVTELIEGIPVDKCIDLDFETRCHICSLIMKLCLHELFVFRYMQTDPNWSNFFFNTNTQKLVLLDFGATRSYSKKFMDEYINIIKAAADREKEVVLEMSRKMGFLTGYESKAMEEAHVETVMILGEVFSDDEAFDFGRQDTTKRVTKLVPTILNNRLCPPPEEIYSLHRKLSGVFLLCAKLKVRISCRPMFMQIYNNYNFEPIVE
ncbi:atypical kinase COQ8B, mitochondrial isoform X2 [Cimex lectularius]|uniref:ABC1 atypical kinase-like domain-containing protein n=1 Tax=Cimex lectularius TaxID=79782 RepID=A0A8I6THE7_CIMLE|nr:atypical kinase COQ8B, mitochondrial isoform X2 [Cimex lectularius]